MHAPGENINQSNLYNYSMLWFGMSLSITSTSAVITVTTQYLLCVTHEHTLPHYVTSLVDTQKC